MTFKKVFAASVAASALFASAPASAVIVISSDFENDGTINVAPNTFVLVNSADGWNRGAPPGSGPIEIQNNVAGAPRAGSGTNFVELDSTQNSSMTWQSMLAAGSYVLNFYYSARPNRQSPTDNGIDVLVNGVSILNTAPMGVGGPTTNWMLISQSFDVASPFALTFIATGASNSFGGYVDDITLDAVPEPATWAMMIGGFGLAGAALRRRRGQMTAKLA